MKNEYFEDKISVSRFRMSQIFLLASVLLSTSFFATSCDFLYGGDEDDDTDDRPVVIAHRGASSVAPENTLAAFSRAAALGADYFELDVQVSRNDSLMVIHDATVDRTTDGSGQVSEMTYEELRTLDAGSWFDSTFASERLPTLYEALALAQGSGINVAVEIKADGIAEDVVRLIEEMGMEEEVIVFAFNFDNIAAAKETNSSIPVLYLKGEMTRADIDRTQGIGGEYVGGGGRTEVTPALLSYAHERGIDVWRWTVNSAPEMRALVDVGIDGIITDYPQRLIALLGEETAPRTGPDRQATP